MIRGSWVWRNGELVERGGPKDVRPVFARSHLPAPLLITDTMEPTQHPCTGEMMTSKAAFRRRTKEHDCIEIGNDPARLKPFQRPKPDRKGIRESLKKAVAQHAAGVRPRARS